MISQAHAKAANPDQPASLTKVSSFFADDEGYFRGNLVNIRLALAAAEKTGAPVAFENFPKARSNEFIYCPKPDADGSPVATEMARIANEALEKLRQNPLFAVIAADSAPPSLDDFREAQRMIHEAVAAGFHDNPFYRYHTSKFEDGTRNGTKKTQNLEDLAQDIETGNVLHDLGMTYQEGADMNRAGDAENYPYSHVCQCETLSILHGIIAQHVSNRLLGDHSGDVMYLSNSSNYRVEENELVEHAALIHTATVMTDEGPQTLVVSVVDESGFDLGKSARSHVEPRPLTLYPPHILTLGQFEQGAPIEIGGIIRDGRPITLHYGMDHRMPPEDPTGHMKLDPEPAGPQASAPITAPNP